MKRVYIYLSVILVAIGGFYLWNHRTRIDFLSKLFPAHRVVEGEITTRSQQLEWKTIDRPSMGFHLDMPGDPQQTVVQATNEMGTNEPVAMLLVKLDGDTTYAVAWAEKPPVARVNDLVPDKTLDQARDGELSRTSSTLITESRSTPQGFAARDVVAHNVGGGVLDTRFVFAGARLYMLIAASPSAAARREEDINRFFNSFAVASNTPIPESIPAATR